MPRVCLSADRRVWRKCSYGRTRLGVLAALLVMEGSSLYCAIVQLYQTDLFSMYCSNQMFEQGFNHDESAEDDAEKQIYESGHSHAYVKAYFWSRSCRDRWFHL